VVQFEIHFMKVKWFSESSMASFKSPWKSSDCVVGGYQYFSKTLVSTYKTACCQYAEDHHLKIQCHDVLKVYIPNRMSQKVYFLILTSNPFSLSLSLSLSLSRARAHTHAHTHTYAQTPCKHSQPVIRERKNC
jgi:hypothetical protein